MFPYKFGWEGDLKTVIFFPRLFEKLQTNDIQTINFNDQPISALFAMHEQRTCFHGVQCERDGGERRRGDIFELFERRDGEISEEIVDIIICR